MLQVYAALADKRSSVREEITNNIVAHCRKAANVRTESTVRSPSVYPGAPVYITFTGYAPASTRLAPVRARTHTTRARARAHARITTTTTTAAHVHIPASATHAHTPHSHAKKKNAGAGAAKHMRLPPLPRAWLTA